MNRRGLISWCLALITVFLVSCGGPAPQAVAPPSYTTVQLEKIQDYATGIQEKYQRMADLQGAINARNWEEAKAIMGGSLGQMLQDMRNLERNLLPQDRLAAQALTRSLFDDFVGIDQAGLINNLDKARKSYNAAVQDFEQFIQLLPPA
jgi:photosystem II protein PsbQ